MLAEVCRQVALIQRFTRFTFSTHVVQKLSVLAICSRLSTSKLFQQWVVHLKIAPKVSLQLGSCLVSRRFLGFSAVVVAQRVMGRTSKYEAPHSFSRLPLCPCVFEASYDPCVVSTVENLKKRLGTRQAPVRTSHSWRKAKQIQHTSSFSINQCKFSARKDRKNVAFIGR